MTRKNTGTWYILFILTASCLLLRELRPVACYDLISGPLAPCTERFCQPPACRCPSPNPPNNLNPSAVPQMVIVSFDLAVTAYVASFFEQLFPIDIINPNGCPIAATFFVPDQERTDYNAVRQLYARGHEIASNSQSRRQPPLWWNSASYLDYVYEIYGQRINLETGTDIPEGKITGMRVPYLQPGGNNMYRMLRDYNFTYDSSMVTGPTSAHNYAVFPPFYPFTLDIPPNNTLCDIYPSNCPNASYPGLWEIPINRMYGTDGQGCAMMDDCKVTTSDDTFNVLLAQFFSEYYNRKRAPYGLYFQGKWLENNQAFDGLKRFIRYINKMDDVFFVTSSQVIEWMKQPTPLSQINSFAPWRSNSGLCGEKK
ncbi:uncharacterized protein LOC106160500 [Lingula anatina]|uniref:Uncharacterized protein LOC106160500 n=1 Tax=Lingula anatina TaxID=7574 RepID=A0A1S3I2W1_LINAN|nr:uncharacterized protein LOC106160500 [Lingula anatina]|eukprot:XP_013392573.1 uncharacterized protein LOC106160500 [Lingula anatina]